jgi:hypothetical protein
VSTDPTPSAASITIESGNPTPEELAALVAVLSTVGGGGDPAPRTRRSAWADPAWRLLDPIARRGWRASSLPR